jgi:hypothetical protein
MGNDRQMEIDGIGVTAMAIVHKIAVAAEISPEIVIANGLVIDRHLLIVGMTRALKTGVPLGIDPVLLIVSRIALLQVNVLSTQKHINSTRRQKLKPMPKSERVSPSLLHRQLGSTPLKRLTGRRRVQPILLRLRPRQSRRPLIVP